MRTPSRQRAMRRSLLAPPPGVNLQDVASKLKYVGSPEHKSRPSFAGPAPKLRSDASKCDPSLGNARQLTGWLRNGLKEGNLGAPWEGSFPRYIWYFGKGQWYEGRLVNRDQGHYKGYPVDADQLPNGLS